MALDLIEIVAVGLCGSDVQRLRAGFDPRSLGHELVGRRPDDRALVAIRPLRPCGVCQWCARGWTEHCPSDTSIGRLDTQQGGFSGRVHASPSQLYPVPTGLAAPIATLADPLACVRHALHNLSLADEEVLIIGDGPMAALAAVHARRRGARHVTMAVKNSGRTERLSAFGDRVVTAEDLKPDHYHVVVESAGGVSSEPILTAVAAVAPLGQVVALGVYPPHLTAGFPVRTLLEKEATLRGSKAYRVNDDRDDFAAALEILARDHNAYAPIVTSTPPWSPDGPRSPLLEHRNPGLKIVYVTEPAPADAPTLKRTIQTCTPPAPG
jgi:L-idonate 5-dehydrogenase